MAGEVGSAGRPGHGQPRRTRAPRLRHSRSRQDDHSRMAADGGHPLLLIRAPLAERPCAGRGSMIQRMITGRRGTHESDRHRGLYDAFRPANVQEDLAKAAAGAIVAAKTW